MLSQEVIKYSFKVKNKIKTTVSILKDKINGLKSMIIIKIYYLFGFESFNLLDIFDDFDYEIKEPKSNNEMLDELFENEDFKKVYNRILDHFYEHIKSENEWLVVISNNNGILSKTKGTLDSVKIPFKVRLMSYFVDFLIIIHNHPLDGVIPSLEDLASILIYGSKFGVITDSRNISILINKNSSFNKQELYNLEKDYDIFRYGLSFKFFNQDYLYRKFKKILNPKVYNNLENNMFGIFISNNIEEFTKDFNYHLKNHNVELMFIKIIKIEKEIVL